MKEKAEVVVTADFSQSVDFPLVKAKFGVYNSGYVPGYLETYRRDIHLFDEVRPAVLRFDGGLGSPSGILLSRPQMVSEVSGQLIYDFAQANELVALLHEHNIKSYWCYSYIPECLSGGNHRNMPRDLEKWAEVCGEVARHFRKTGRGIACHEIYNEPDNRDFFNGSLDDYLTLYEAAVKAIRKSDPEAKVGGPALAFTDSWIDPFLERVVQRDLPLDFFSFHFYPGVPYSKPTVGEVIEMVRMKLEKHPELDSCEMHLTEYNSLPINYPEDGPQQKHRLAALLLRDFELFLREPRLTQVHWAQFMDTGGGNWSGMISINGHRKAVFNAYKIYSMMPVERRSLIIDGPSELGGMASSDACRAAAVFWNLTGKSQRVTAHLKNLRFPKGTLRVYRIDGDHASWGDNPEKEELVPVKTSSNVKTPNLEWNGTIPDGGVVLLEVESQSRAVDPKQMGQTQIRFEDITEESGLKKPLAGIMGHGGAVGDVNGDGRLDIFTGGFCDRPNEEYAPAAGPVPCRLFISKGDGTFELTADPTTAICGRTSGAVFADLDNNGTLELYVANNCRGESKLDSEPQRSAQLLRSRLFRNDDGKLVCISEESGACPESLLSVRNIGVLDYDNDGLLDLLVLEDRFTEKPRSALLRNLGDLQFADVTAQVGLPEYLFGLGLAVADLNRDGIPDFFVAHSNRLFLSAKHGQYVEPNPLKSVFAWKPVNPSDKEDWPCGAAFCDLNRDGELDMVLSIHHDRARNRVFLNDGLENGVPRFRDVSAEAGLPAELATKSPHVEIQDFDNDGLPDLYFSSAWLDAEGNITPLVYRNQGLKDGIPQFLGPESPQGEPVYFPAGPCGDFDRDGRLDLLLINWFQGNHCRLLRNVSSPENSWLQVQVMGTQMNRMGIGAQVRVYEPDKMGEREALLGYREVATGYGYASGQEAVCHFGLGRRTEADVEVTLPSGVVIRHARVKGNQRLTVTETDLPPRIPRGKAVVTDSSSEMLQGTATLKSGVKTAKTPPEVDFMYYSGQDYQANLWSAWGDNLAVGKKCFSSIGDHDGPQGNAFVYQYDAVTKELKEVADVRSALMIPDGTTYTPGKIHSRLDLGKDGWLYFSTHRGSTKVTTAQYNYKGDWILRYHPESEQTEIVAHAPLPMQCLPASHLDPNRLIFYAGTADGDWNNKRTQFLAYDVAKRKVLYSDDQGPSRCMIFARSTGRVYFHGGDNPTDLDASEKPRNMLCFDPSSPGNLRRTEAALGLRACSEETSDGLVYTVDSDSLWVFDTKTETVRHLGPAAVGENTYITSIDIDPRTERYLYYVPGAHGGAHKDGSPLVQFDTQTNTRKVICFLHPFYHRKYGFIPCGAFGTAVSPEGDKVYITWNGNRNTPLNRVGERVNFDICAFMVVQVPESERMP